MGTPEHNAVHVAAGAERREHVLRLRSGGWTFRRISAELRVGHSRIPQIYNRAVRPRQKNPKIGAEAVKQETLKFMLPLSVRDDSALRNGGCKTLADLLPLTMPRRVNSQSCQTSSDPASMNWPK